VSVLNWADRADGPSISDVRGRFGGVMMCGMDHVGTIVEGTGADLATEILDAVEQAGEAPFIVGPGCSFPSDTPESKLGMVYETLATAEEGA